MKPIQPDAHLRAALQHAPDAAVQAPPDLSAQIVAAAHRAAAQAPARAAKPAGRWWPWHRTWRMGASGAFASVLMAGMIGLLWRGEPPGPTQPETAPLAALPAAASPAPVAETRATQETSALAQPPKVIAASPPAKLARAPQPAPAAAPPATPAPPERPARPEQPAPASLTAAAPEPPSVAEKASADIRIQRARGAMDSTPATAAATAPAPEVARPATSSAAPLSLSGSRVATGAASAQGAGGGMSSALAPATKAQAAPPESLPLPGASPVGPAATLFLPGPARAADPALLQAVLRHTAGRWVASPGAQPQAGEVPLEWRQGHQVVGRLWLGDQRALLCPPQGDSSACQLAPLSPQAAAELKEKLPR